MNSFLKNIVEFIEVLRLAGVRASLSESMDAVKALQHINVLSRAEVRAALSACLAKSDEERKLFQTVFDRFFIDPEERSHWAASKREQLAQKKHEIAENAAELRFQEMQLEIRDDLKEIYTALPEDLKQSILSFLAKTSAGKNVGPAFKSIAEAMVHSRLSKLKTTFAGSAAAKQGMMETVLSEAGLIAREVAEVRQQENDLMYKNIGDLRSEDLPNVIRLIKQFAETLRKNMLRRYKTSKKKARLDFKKTLRSNLTTGGIQFRLKYRQKPRHRQKLLVLCDVSASMYRFSGFVLQFTTGMHQNTAAAESYLFSEAVEHLNMQGFVNAMEFERTVKQSKVWRRGTDICKAVEHLLYESRTVLNASTVVIMVSDAKTLNSDKAAQSLKLLAARVKRIIWLNPVPEAEWQGITGTENFREHCLMMDCSTIERLSKACAALPLG